MLGRLSRHARQLWSVLTTLRFDPTRETVIAVATLLVFWGLYYASWTLATTGLSVALFVAGMLVVAVLVPVYYIYRQGQSLSNLGIKTAGWRRALTLSVLFVLVSAPTFWIEGYTEEFPPTELAVHVLTNGLLLWEPLFVYGWLQIRYEDAFGPIPGIVLAGTSFGIYHLGTYPLAGVLALAVFGCLYAVLFRLARWNLLVLWPLTWAVGSGLGTLDGGIRFGVADALGWLGVLIVTAGVIWVLSRRR